MKASGGSYTHPSAIGSVGIGVASHFHPSLPCVPSQNGRFDDIPQRQSEIAGFPVKSHSFPFTSTREIGPSTRNGPFGRTVIFTAVAAAGTAFNTSSDITILWSLFERHLSNRARIANVEEATSLLGCHSVAQQPALSEAEWEESAFPLNATIVIEGNSSFTSAMPHSHACHLRRPLLVYLDLIDIAPAPILPRLHRPHNRVLRRMKVLRRMFIRRGVAAPHMPALHAHPQMHPPPANLQTILTTLRRRLHLMNVVKMSTFHSQHLPSPKF